MGKIERLWEEHTRLLMATKDAAHALRTLTNAARAHRNAMSITSSTVANRRKQARASVAVESACMDADRMATALEKPASDSIASHLTAAIPQPAPDVQAALVTALEQVKAALGGSASRQRPALKGIRAQRHAADQRRSHARREKAMSEPIRKLCTLCERRPAMRAAGKSGRAGTDFCDACWREEFTDPRGDL